MSPIIGKVLVEITKTVGKAMLAGFGMELARTAGDQLRRRIPGKDDEEDEDEAAVKKRNEELEAEVKRLREELDAVRREASHPAPEPGR